MSFQEWVALLPLSLRQAGIGQNGGNQVEMGTHRICPASAGVARIDDHQRHVDGFAESHAPFLAQVMGAAHLAVIRGKNDDRIIGLAGHFQGIQHCSDMPVYIEMAVKVVVDMVMPHIPAIHRNPAIVHVTQVLVSADGRRLSLQVIEEGTRQGRLPFLVVKRRIGRVKDREHAFDLDHLFGVRIEEHDVVRVDEIHGHVPGLSRSNLRGTLRQPVGDISRNLTDLLKIHP